MTTITRLVAVLILSQCIGCGSNTASKQKSEQSKDRESQAVVEQPKQPPSLLEQFQTRLAAYTELKTKLEAADKNGDADFCSKNSSRALDENYEQLALIVDIPDEAMPRSERAENARRLIADRESLAKIAIRVAFDSVKLPNTKKTERLLAELRTNPDSARTKEILDELKRFCDQQMEATESMLARTKELGREFADVEKKRFERIGPKIRELIHSTPKEAP
ncbi:MAG TPA: hypothetical protein VGP72_12485 [Planctomycetota bacterium]|jgi:predicted  nucleic acid-binding Zn-ribbon protein